jgi:hypothetical protein
LAAVTSALVGSFLGVAGTLIGAALGSVVATVGAAVYARTLSSATTVAMKKIPLRRRDGLPAGDGEVLAASALAESVEPRPKRARKQFTLKTWIKLGAVSAAAFVIAMVGLTAVEFGTNQPISSLVSSTSGIDSGETGQTTTLGKAFGGTPAVSNEADESAKNPAEVPAQVEEGASGEGALTTDSIPSGGDTGSAGTEEPAADGSSDTTPADLAPETEQSAEPAPAPEQTSEPEVPSDSGAVEQPAR